MKENDTFEVEEDCIKIFFACITNLKEKDNACMNDCVDKIDACKDDKLYLYVRSSLSKHLSSFRKIKINDLHWQFMLQNLNRTYVIIKLLKMNVRYDVLRKIERHNTLFNLDSHVNNQITSINKIEEHGCYLVC